MTTEITYRKQIDAVLDDARFDGEDFCASVDVPNSTRDGVDAYDAACDKIMAELKSALPGWSIRWAGSGSTDEDGDCTEDLYLTPPEVDGEAEFLTIGTDCLQ